MMPLEVFEFWLKTKIEAYLEAQEKCKDESDRKAIGYDLRTYENALSRFQQFKIEYEQRNRK